MDDQVEEPLEHFLDQLPLASQCDHEIAMAESLMLEKTGSGDTMKIQPEDFSIGLLGSGGGRDGRIAFAGSISNKLLAALREELGMGSTGGGGVETDLIIAFRTALSAILGDREL